MTLEMPVLWFLEQPKYPSVTYMHVLSLFTDAMAETESKGESSEKLAVEFVEVTLQAVA